MLPEHALARVQQEMAATLRAATLHDAEQVAPAGMSTQRLGIYRRLIHDNQASLLAATFPVLRSLHDELAWAELVSAFIAGHRAQTPLFHELPAEFLLWLQGAGAVQLQRMPCMLELAHYEWMELAAMLAEAGPEDWQIDSQGDVLSAVPVLSALAWPLVYHFPVHSIGPGHVPLQPSDQPVCLLIWRDAGEQVRFMALNALSMALLQALQQQRGLPLASCKTGSQLLQQLQCDFALPDLQQTGQVLLQQWRDHGVITGTLL